MDITIKDIDIKMSKDGYMDIRLHSDGKATIQTGEPPFYKILQNVG